MTLDELRSELVAQVALRAPASTVPAAPASNAAPSANSPATETAESARGASLNLVDHAVGRGVWSEEDSAQFNLLLGQMTGVQRDEAQAALFERSTSGG